MGAMRTCLTNNLTPLLLRLALGLTFLWAGWGKVWVKVDFAPDALAQLANMGVDRARDAASRAPAPSLPDAQTPPPNTGSVSLVQNGAAPSTPGRVYTAADFAGPAQLPGLYGLALFLQGSATGDKPILPASVGRDAWPVRLGARRGVDRTAGRARSC